MPACWIRGTVALLLAFTPICAVAAPVVESAVLTLYSESPSGQGFAWVEERREIELQAGPNRLAWSPVPRSVAPRSLVVEPLAAEAKAAWKHFVITIPAMDRDVLVESIGAPVTVESKSGQGRTYSGTLVRAGPPLVLRDAAGKLHVMMDPGRVEIAEPGGAGRDVPAVTLEVDASRQGKWPVAVRYETPDLKWRAEHWATLSPDVSENRGRLELSTSFTVDNATELTWQNARLRLVAGTLHRAVQPSPWSTRVGRKEVVAAAMAETAPQLERAGEYYEFSVPRPLTLPARSHVMVGGPGPFRDIPYEQEFLCRHSAAWVPMGKSAPMLERGPTDGQRLPVDVVLRVRTGKANGVDVPLAGGVLHVGRKRSPDATWQFLGDVEIPHTPVGDALEVPFGVAFDIVGERKVTDFAVVTDQRQLEEAVEVMIRNYKEKPAEVRVIETLYRTSEWEIVTSQPQYEKTDANTIAFRITAPAQGQAKVTYRVRYRW